MKYFIMTDIHSFFTIMQLSLMQKGFDIDNKDHILIVCGDLFDRGDESVEVFNFVKHLAEQNRFIYIGGNHEDLLKECLQEIYDGEYISEHHYHNKTVKTICQFCGYKSEWNLTPAYRDVNEIKSHMQPVIDFIDKYAVNYYELDNNIFVHGWLPTPYVDYKLAENYKWVSAKWENGMDRWKELQESSEATLNDKTIYCGHWHCSYGNSHFHLDKHLKEFPSPNSKKFNESFEPFIDKGIVAFDSCCAYSGMLNCLVIEK